jgi:uncharacterized protein
METFIELEIVDVQNSQTPNDAYVLILKEKGGVRIIPVIIGLSEAKTIVLILNNVKSRRPTPHELFKNLTEHCGFVISQIVIEQFIEGIYYSKIVLSKDLEVINLDARTSDAVSLALLFKAPIFIEQTILDQVAILPSEKKENNFEFSEEEFLDNIEYDQFIDQKIKEMKDEELETLLQGAIESEDFELATKIHEEIELRKSK